MKFNDECLTNEDRPERIVPCPSCGSIQNITWLYWPTRGQMDIMCWDVCGMDFVNITSSPISLIVTGKQFFLVYPHSLDIYH